jgi:hypothetical protein
VHHSAGGAGGLHVVCSISGGASSYCHILSMSSNNLSRQKGHFWYSSIGIPSRPSAFIFFKTRSAVSFSRRDSVSFLRRAAWPRSGWSGLLSSADVAANFWAAKSRHSAARVSVVSSSPLLHSVLVEPSGCCTRLGARVGALLEKLGRFPLRVRTTSAARLESPTGVWLAAGWLAGCWLAAGWSDVSLLSPAGRSRRIAVRCGGHGRGWPWPWLAAVLCCARRAVLCTAQADGGLGCLHRLCARGKTQNSRRHERRGMLSAAVLQLLLAPTAVVAAASAAVRRHDAFPADGEYWTDTEGHIIDAHGAGLLRVGLTHYWYGSQRHGHPNVAPRGTYPRYSAYCYPPPDSDYHARDGGGREERQRASAGDGFTEGVNLYVSDGDLYNWRHAGLVFPANATGAHCLERPKVIRCPTTGQFVLWAKGFTPANSSFRGTKVAVVATSASPLGPFKLSNPDAPFFAPGGASMADATVYVDARGEAAWLYWRSPSPTSGFFVGRLTPDCTRLQGAPVRVADIKHEAPAVFEADGRLYLWTSSTSGFSANGAKLLVSESGALEGPFIETGNPTHNSSTFDTQSTYVLPNPAWNDTAAAAGLARFIYISDRWQPQTSEFGKYLWLPLVVNSSTQSLNSTVTVTNPRLGWRYTQPVP